MQRFTKQFEALAVGIWLALMPVQAATQEKADYTQSEQDEIAFYGSHIVSVISFLIILL